MSKFMRKISLVSRLESTYPFHECPEPDKHIDQWSKAEIYHFLRFIPLEDESIKTDAFHLYYKALTFKSGQELVKIINSPHLVKKIDNLNHRLTIRFFFNQLILFHGGKFNRNIFVVMSKLLRTEKRFSGPLMDRLSTLLDLSQDSSFLQQCSEMCSCLLDPNRYFDLIKLSQTNSSPLSKEEDTLSTLTSPELKKAEDECMNRFYDCSSEKGFRIKLILTSIAPTTSFFDRILSNSFHAIAKLLNKQLYTPFASFHAMLLVGPYVIEFNQSGLVIPRPFHRGNVIMMMDVVPPIPYKNETEKQEVLAKLQETLFFAANMYNTKIEYDRAPRQNSTTTGNCQSFVDYLLKLLIEDFDIDSKKNLLNDEGCIKQYMKYITSTVTPKYILYLSTKFKEALGGTIKGVQLQKQIEFSSHEELDTFVFEVSAILGGMEAFMEQFPAEYFLLKSFDRIFWSQLLFSNMNDFEKEAQGDRFRMKDLFENLKSRCRPTAFSMREGLDVVDISKQLEKGDTSAFSCICPFNNPTETLYVRK